jgi:Cu/Ag efflux protein CusF
MKRKIAILSAILIFALAQANRMHAQMGAGDAMGGVDVMKVTAKVEKIDASNRKVTLMMDNGKKKTIKCGPEVKNFDQIKVGDTVHMTYTEETVLAVSAGGGAMGAASGQTMTSAPKGAMPAGTITDTVAVQAKILAIDSTKPSVTVQTAAGKKRTIKVSKDADLSQLKVGDTFTLMVRDSLAVAVTK